MQAVNNERLITLDEKEIIAYNSSAPNTHTEFHIRWGGTFPYIYRRIL